MKNRRWEPYVNDPGTLKDVIVPLRIFCASHDGHYMGGYSVVVAKDRRTARRILLRELKAQGLNPKVFDMHELDITKEGVDLLYDGEY